VDRHGAHSSDSNNLRRDDAITTKAATANPSEDTRHGRHRQSADQYAASASHGPTFLRPMFREAEREKNAATNPPATAVAPRRRGKEIAASGDDQRAAAAAEPRHKG